VDPFLPSQDGGSAVALHDLGHLVETQEAFVPRTPSFGEALRKRYREETENEVADGDEGEGVSVSLPFM
jgi:chromosome transmission fidelity protein 4